MATAKHGRNAMAYADLSPTATGVLTVIPMILDYSIDGSTDTIETTSCDSVNKEYLASFKNFEGTISANTDGDLDALYNASDGLPRALLFYWDRFAVAGKRRYEYGPVTFSRTTAGGVSQQIKESIKFKATGSITHGWA